MVRSAVHSALNTMPPDPEEPEPARNRLRPTSPNLRRSCPSLAVVVVVVVVEVTELWVEVVVVTVRRSGGAQIGGLGVGHRSGEAAAGERHVGETDVPAVAHEQIGQAGARLGGMKDHRERARPSGAEHHPHALVGKDAEVLWIIAPYLDGGHADRPATGVGDRRGERSARLADPDEVEDEWAVGREVRPARRGARSEHRSAIGDDGHERSRQADDRQSPHQRAQERASSSRGMRASIVHDPSGLVATARLFSYRTRTSSTHVRRAAVTVLRFENGC